ncbi:hypothetical protein ACT6NV_04430 [Robiginitalea sp. IMCC44478]|uniref:hypothetical protein n=1 Tax=Robiginitalea sp. IMCC44478 TaxID=3459122 RepID=UPI004042D656
MKSLFRLVLLILLLCNCSKEDVEPVSSFSGILLNSSNNQPIADGVVTIIGYEDTSFFDGDRQRFSTASITNASGAFDFDATIPNTVDYLVIRVKIPGDFFTTTECSPVSCSGLKPGKNYKGLTLRVSIN